MKLFSYSMLRIIYFNFQYYPKILKIATYIMYTNRMIALQSYHCSNNDRIDSLNLWLNWKKNNNDPAVISLMKRELTLKWTEYLRMRKGSILNLFNCCCGTWYSYLNVVRKLTQIRNLLQFNRYSYVSSANCYGS